MLCSSGFMFKKAPFLEANQITAMLTADRTLKYK